MEFAPGSESLLLFMADEKSLQVKVGNYAETDIPITSIGVVDYRTIEYWESRFNKSSEEIKLQSESGGRTAPPTRKAIELIRKSPSQPREQSDATR